MSAIGVAVGFLDEALFVGFVIVSTSLFYIRKQLAKISESVRTNKSKEEKLQ